MQIEHDRLAAIPRGAGSSRPSRFAMPGSTGRAVIMPMHVATGNYPHGHVLLVADIRWIGDQSHTLMGFASYYIHLECSFRSALAVGSIPPGERIRRRDSAFDVRIRTLVAKFRCRSLRAFSSQLIHHSSSHAKVVVLRRLW